jgi:putative transposase
LVGPNPTDRAKRGVKRSVLTEADGGPIAVVVSGGNRHDSMVMQDTLEAVVTPPPNPVTELKQRLCMDKGYSGAPADATARVFGYEPHCKQIGAEKLDESGRKRHPARRWVAEHCLSRWSGCRAILVRWAKTSDNHAAWIDLQSALLRCRRMKQRLNLSG